jgi:polysaccharide biosynthesis transport protein
MRTAAPHRSTAALPLPSHARPGPHRTRDPDLDENPWPGRYPALPRAAQLPSPKCRILDILNDAKPHPLNTGDRSVQTFQPQLTPLQQQVLNLLNIPARKLHLTPQVGGYIDCEKCGTSVGPPLPAYLDRSRPVPGMKSRGSCHPLELKWVDANTANEPAQYPKPPREARHLCTKRNETFVELKDYIRVIRKRWQIIVAVMLVTVAGAALATVLSPNVYEAQTLLFVSTSGGNDSSALLSGSSFTQQRVLSYADVITTPTVLDPVIETLQLNTTAADLGAQITATVPLNTVMIQVAVQNTNPQMAAAVAGAVGKQFTKTVADLESVTKGQFSPVKVTIVSAPTVPTAPISPKRTRNLALGGVLGLLLGLGLALLRDLLDTTIKSEKDCAEVTDATVIGGIAFDPDAAKSPLIAQVDPHSPRAEAFRTLRTNLKFVDAARHPRSIVFTSSVPTEGKTTTTANLAITMAAAGARICVVEGDLRRPRLLEYMGLDGSVGLTDVLIGQATLGDVLQQFADTSVYVLGAGAIPPNPSELLGSASMIETLRELESRFDVVIIDTPPLLPVTDAAVLSTIAGGTVVVVGAGRVDRDHLSRSLQSLETVKARVLGLVLNMIPTKRADGYSYGRGYASESPRQRAKERERAVS